MLQVEQALMLADSVRVEQAHAAEVVASATAQIMFHASLVISPSSVSWRNSAASAELVEAAALERRYVFSGRARSGPAHGCFVGRSGFSLTLRISGTMPRAPVVPSLTPVVPAGNRPFVPQRGSGFPATSTDN